MSNPNSSKQSQQQPSTPAEGNGRGPADFEKVGPRSIEGLGASELPDKGRGDVFTDPNKEAGRKLPSQTGQWGDAGDTGLRADPDIADTNDHGRSRKHS